MLRLNVDAITSLNLLHIGRRFATRLGAIVNPRARRRRFWSEVWRQGRLANRFLADCTFLGAGAGAA